MKKIMYLCILTLLLTDCATREQPEKSAENAISSTMEEASQTQPCWKQHHRKPNRLPPK